MAAFTRKNCRPCLSLNVEDDCSNHIFASTIKKFILHQYEDVKEYHEALTKYTKDTLLKTCITTYIEWYNILTNTTTNPIVVNQYTPSTREKIYTQRKGTQEEKFLFTNPIKFNPLRTKPVGI